MWFWTCAALAAGPWASLGPIVPPAKLVSEAAGPDLVRAEIEEGGRHYWIDVTPDTEQAAFCRGGGLTLQVRLHLDVPEESFDLQPVPVPVSTACAALETAAPALRKAMAESAPLPPTPVDAANPARPGPDGVPTDPRADTPTGEAWWSAGQRPVALFAVRPFQAVVAVWAGIVALALGLALWRAPRTVTAGFAWFAAAYLVRARLSPLTVLLGGDAAYERLVSALGRGATDRYYGETWPSFFGLLHEAGAALGLLPSPATDVVHEVNLWVSAATVALAWGVARRARFGAVPAVLIAAVLTVLPHAVSLARTEDHAVLVAGLQVLTALGVLGASPADEALAVASATMLAHLRPDQLPTAAVLLLPLLWRRRWVALSLGILGVGARLGYLDAPSGQGPIQFSRLLDLETWPTLLRAWVGAPAVPTPGLYALAAAGLVLGLRGNRERRPFVAWAGLVWFGTTSLYLPKETPAADPLRFSLPSTAWTVLLAGVGGTELFAMFQGARGRKIAAVLVTIGVLLAGSWRPSRTSSSRPWAWESEYTFLRGHLPTSPAGDPAAPNGQARGWYDDSQDPNGAFGRWLTVATGTTWTPWGAGTPAPGDLVYRGTADRLAGHFLGQRCGLDPISEAETPPSSDGWVDFGPDPVRFSLYRVRECGAPVSN